MDKNVVCKTGSYIETALTHHATKKFKSTSAHTNIYIKFKHFTRAKTEPSHTVSCTCHPERQWKPHGHEQMSNASYH